MTTRRRNTKAPGLVASGVSKRLSSNAPPEALIGHKLKRFFRGYGTFTGTVTEAHKRYDKVYVLFDDGDRLLFVSTYLPSTLYHILASCRCIEYYSYHDGLDGLLSADGHSIWSGTNGRMPS